jgi:hypothetical protein
MACVWTSNSATGKPLKRYKAGQAVYLIAAWHIGSVAGLGRYHLSLRWTAYSGYQADVSLAPLDINRISVTTVNDPLTPTQGTYRLAKAPKLANLPSGWYSLVAQAILYGPHCKRGCGGNLRQNRFDIR